MANITRFDPFKELAAFDPFGDKWPRFPRWLRETPAEPAIKLDVSEDDKAFHVKAEMPGVKKEDIEVKVDGNEVSLSAEVKREKEEKEGQTVVHTERYYGKQYRSFTLGEDIDRSKAEAKFNDGILELTLPKAGTPKSERISVQ